MALKSIIDIDVKDDSFKAFQELFDKHREEVDKLPKTWEEVGEAVGTAGTHIAEIIAATAMLLAETDKVRKEHDKLNSELDRTRRQTQDVERHTEGIARHIASATKEFLKWDAVIAGLSGLVGAGGLFGIERLAQVAGATRRTATGYGVTPQEYQAARINLGSYVDVNSTLGGVAEAKSTIAGQQWLQRTGLTPGQIQSLSATQIQDRLLLNLKSIVGDKLTPRKEAELQARGYEHFFSNPDIQRIAATPQAQLEKSIAQENLDTKQLALPEGTRRSWQAFTRQLDRASTEISNTLIKDLVGLTPGLSKLSVGVEKLINAFLTAPEVKKWIDDLGKGLSEFAAFIGTPKFAKDVQDFVTDLAKLAQAIGGAVKWIDSFIPSKPADKPHPATDKPKPETKPLDKWHQDLKDYNERQKKEPPFVLDWFKRQFAPAPDGMALPPGTQYYIPQDYIPPRPPSVPRLTEAAFHSWGGRMMPDGPGQGGVTPQLLDAVEKVESGGNPYAVSPKGALGAYQFMPDTARQYGIKNPFDPVEERNAARRMFGDLIGHYSGDVQKAIAAYNWGSGNVDQDVSKHGSDWRNFLPAETKNYLGRIMESMAAQRGSHVRIENNTGGSAVIITSQLAV